MKKHIVGILVVALAVFAWGCGSQQETQVAHTQEGGASEATVYCGKCGHAKGTDQCCAEGAEVCTKCNLHKGSALCCKVQGDAAGKDLCGKCGQVAGSEKCCAKDAEVCEHCKLHKGSALCCKLTEQSPSADPNNTAERESTDDATETEADDSAQN